MCVCVCVRAFNKIHQYHREIEDKYGDRCCLDALAE